MSALLERDLVGDEVTDLCDAEFDPAAYFDRWLKFLDQKFDYVITVCDRARATCPVFPGSSNTLHWGLDDPSEVEGSDQQKVEAFRRTETEVSARLRPFIEVALRAADRPRRPALA